VRRSGGRGQRAKSSRMDKFYYRDIASGAFLIGPYDSEGEARDAALAAKKGFAEVLRKRGDAWEVVFRSSLRELERERRGRPRRSINP
jgi:hypothetical protein